MIPLNLILTAVTNFLAAMVFVFCAGVLVKRNRLSAYLAVAFMLIAVGFLLAGIAHGFYEFLGPPKTQIEIWLRSISWIFSVLGLYFFMYVLLKFYKFKFLKCFMLIAAFFMGINLLLGVKDMNFLYINIAHIPFLISVIFYGIKYFKQKYAKYLLLGVGITIIGAIIQVSHFKPFYPLDHNGLYHLCMFVSSFAYLGWGLGIKQK